MPQPASVNHSLRIEKAGRFRQPDVQNRLAAAATSKGKTNEEIAAVLQISIPTVKKHVERILRKLRVKNRLAAAVAASEICARLTSEAENSRPKQTSSSG